MARALCECARPIVSTHSTSRFFGPAPRIHATVRGWRWCLLLSGMWLGLPDALALKPTDPFGMSDLENEPNLTPGHFADLFEDFAFEYFPYVQSPDNFLRNRSGNCKDYALLGDYILSRGGYKTRLIRVELAGTDISHVICYVTEKKAYLDYNSRQYFFNLERSGPSIREIATEVADSFGKNWTSATEYTYSYKDNRAQPVRTVVKTDPPDHDPDRISSR